MKPGVKLALAGTLASILSVGIAWWWIHNMERKLVAARIQQGDHPDQQFLAMKQLLQRRGITVEIRDNLSQVRNLASVDDAIYLADGASTFPNSLAEPLLAWIDRGGTLLAQTPWGLDTADEHLFGPLGVRIRSSSSDESAEPEDTTEGLVPQPGLDSLPESVEEESVDTGPTMILPGLPGDPAGSSMTDSTDSVAMDPGDDDVEEEEIAEPDSGKAIRLPGRGDSLFVSSLGWEAHLYVEPPAIAAWSDTADSTIVVVRHGRGFAVATSNTGRFEGFELQALDHAELLVRLLSWRQKPTKVWIVRDTSIMPWWAWLLDRAWGVVAFAALLAALWAWNRLRRFGPVLTDPDVDRRPLLEHIDASARWIWNSPGGPESLLSALRASVTRDLALRHPSWVELPPEELARELALLHGLPATEVHRALDPEFVHFRQPTTSPQELVRMVAILRKLKERA